MVNRDAVIQGGRTTVGAEARLSWDEDHRFRPGIEAVMKSEMAQFMELNKPKVGHLWGELAFGVYVGGFVDRKTIGISAGLLGRSPIGILLVGPDKI